MSDNCLVPISVEHFPSKLKTEHDKVKYRYTGPLEKLKNSSATTTVSYKQKKKKHLHS